MESEETLIDELMSGFNALKSIVFDLETLRRSIEDDGFIDSQLFAISTIAKSRMSRFEDDLISYIEMKSFGRTADDEGFSSNDRDRQEPFEYEEESRYDRDPDDYDDDYWWMR